ncbi:HAD hydrolase-like protein [Cellulomonas sp. PhB143]|uniref:HAD hydrolase-like protein n=1 Tax=Cellulomonas sp. PhB143 TaxID=2485186 RepID=UPI000F4AB657|nr:HAD hydrolase-like protein [Cellulomonas sp. PhB143]ROS79049.1 phosphoglycolate phosphatase [Cellulomonas sp. PhB143]
MDTDDTAATGPALARPPRLALLDLDGTLTDSAPGIISSMRAALVELGLPLPDDAGFRRMVGPPLAQSLTGLGVPAGRTDEVIAVYRQYFRAGGMLGGNSVFPGVPEALARLRAAGVRLAVATSKPEVFAREIVDHFDLARFLVGGVDAVFGADADDGPRSSKADVIAHALAVLGASGVPTGAGGAVMVGDREHDVRGAAAHGIPTVAVAWGYAEAGEVEAAGASAVVRTPAELADLLLP